MTPEELELPADSSFPSSATAEAARAGGRTILTDGRHVCDWIEEHCVHAAGSYMGKPFRFLPWQRRLIYELFEVRADGEGGWVRRYRWALIGIPKKNGKTELAAALAVWFLLADHERAPVVVTAAASDDQAKLVFGAAKHMCELSPTLSRVCRPMQREITVRDKPGAVIQRVAAVEGANDGKNIHVAVLDELHEWVEGKGEGCWTVLTNGIGARTQPMIIQITTAGHDEETLCYTQYHYGKRVRDGSQVDDRYYFAWWEAPEDAPHDDPAVWEACNPSWGLILQRDFYEDQLTKKSEAQFRRYFMNQWTEAEEIWEAAALWDRLAGRPKFDRALPLFVAVDVGLRHDSSTVVWVQMLDGKLQVAQEIWENPFPFDDSRHGVWKQDPRLIETVLRGLWDKFPESAMKDEDDYPLPGPAFLYDPHFFNRSAEVLAGDGMNMVETPQTDQRMVPASQRLFQLVKSSELVHDGDPRARRQIRSVVAKERERGWRISKPTGSRKRIDFAVALAMAALPATDVLGQDDMPSVW